MSHVWCCRCVSEVNKAGVPFSVWTVLHRNWGWVRDTTLRSDTCTGRDL